MRHKGKQIKQTGLFQDRHPFTPGFPDVRGEPSGLVMSLQNTKSKKTHQWRVVHAMNSFPHAVVKS